MADSLLTALSPEYMGDGGCNANFLREDAVLVVTIITDEDDSGNDPYFTSPGDPAGWENASPSTLSTTSVVDNLRRKFR